MQLILTNNLSKKQYTFEVNDLNDSNIYYHFKLTLSEGMDDGEYSYALYNNNKLVSRGLAQIGDYVSEKTTYTKTENGYIQYNA